MKNKDICDKFNLMIPNPKCELNYNKDYELLIAVMLSAQCTDKRVNIVTEKIFSKYNLKTLNNLDIKEVEKLIKSLGSYTKKAEYLKDITSHLLNDYNGIVPNDRIYLESLKGVGHKTCNVVLSELFNEPTFAVDTHVHRVANRLGFIKSDNLDKIEKKLTSMFDREDWNRINHQMVLFGRYICTSINPKCEKCLFKDKCKKGFTIK